MKTSGFPFWCKASQRSLRGLHIIANAVQDVKNGRVSKAAVQRFCEQVEARYEKHKSVSTVDRIPDVDKYYESIVNEDSMNLLCKGNALDSFRVRCSRVVIAEDFLRHNIRGKDMGWPDDDDDHPLERLDELSNEVEDGKLGNLAKGQMKGTRPMAWVTKTDECEQLLRYVPKSEQPMRIRDALGLVHYRGNEILIEVLYPENHFQYGVLRAATFLDGGTKLVYRSRTNAGNDWGRAVHLQTGGDGLAEAVHKAISCTEAFGFRVIGELTGVDHSFHFAKIVNWNGCSGCDPHNNFCQISEYAHS